MKKLLSFFSLLTIAVAMSAQTVSLATAQSKAAALLSKTTSAKGGTQYANVTLAYTAQSGDETYYYVFNSPEGGFVIIGGDEAAREVLGYSENGSFDYDKLPENMKWWLDQYTQQISTAIKGVKDGSLVLDKSTAAKGASIMAAKSDIPMMIRTIWNQSYPYNSELPDLGAGQGRLVTGCVATAAAQIMKYWNYPTQGIGSKSYTRTWAAPIGTKTFQADFANTTYDWENMCIAYDGNETAEKMKAVGTLMYHVGVAANMIYGVDGSGANEGIMANGLIEYFGYDKGMSQQMRTLYSSDEKWEDMIYTELSAGRPILYSGRSRTIGHTFVVDGYRSEDNKFHVNWGWGGYCDGYFPLTGTNALTPNGTGIGGGAEGASYINSQTAIIGIQPDAGNKLVKSMFCTEYGIGDYGTDSYRNKSLTRAAGTRINLLTREAADYGFFNGSLMATDLEVGAMFVNQSTSAVVCVTDMDISWDNIGVNSGQNLIYAWIPVDMPAGDYYVYPAFKDENGNWQKMEMSAQTIPTLTVTPITGDLIIVSEPKWSNEGYITPSEGTLTVRIKNTTYRTISTYGVFGCVSNGTTSDGVHWSWPTSTGRAYVKNEVTFSPGETKEFIFTESDLQGVTYTKTTSTSKWAILFRYYDYATSSWEYVKPSEYWNYVVVDNIDISYTLTSAGWGTICLPFTADVPSGITAYEVTGSVGGALMMNTVSKLEMNKPYLVTGTAGTYDFRGPDTPEGQYTNGLLTGNTASGTVYAPKDSYVLQNLSSGVGFYKVANNDRQQCGQYKAYLTKSPTLTSFPYFLLDGTTGVDDAEAVAEQQGNNTVMKVMKDGKLTIVKDGKAYNAIGIMQPAF